MPSKDRGLGGEAETAAEKRLYDVDAERRIVTKRRKKFSELPE